MPISEAKLAANRRNAARSTGPRTPEGKERSRRNALKHGLTGSGVALPDEDRAEIDRRYAALQSEMSPASEAGAAFLRRFAFMTVRIERCERHETAETSKRVRHAVARFDDERLAAVEARGARIYQELATPARRLQMTPEGIDWLLKEWAILRADLLHEDGNRWTTNHRSRFDSLLGLNPGGYRIARIMALSEAVLGGFYHLDKSDGEGLEGPARSAWAKGELTRLIDVETDRLEEARARIDHESLAADRAQAVDRALFDPSPEMVLARKYEAATERAMYKAYKEFKQAEADFAGGREPELTTCEVEDCEPVGSNSQDEPEVTAEDEPEAPPARREAEFAPSGVSILDISIGQVPEIVPGPPERIDQG